MSVLAGIFISIGAIVYLKVGGVVGATLFSVGLMSVLAFQAKLFTGKAGLLVHREINPLELGKIWLGNWFGCFLVAFLVALTPLGAVLGEAAAAIAAVRIANGFWVNVIMGIGCGILMTCAVEGYKRTDNWLFAIIPVAVFILIGFNHCVADMFYLMISTHTVGGAYTLLPTTIGNIIGCNLGGVIQVLDKLLQEPEKEVEATKTIGFEVPRESQPKEELKE